LRSRDDGRSYLALHRSLQWSVLHQLHSDQQNRGVVFNRAFLLLRGLIPEKAPLEMFTYQASSGFKKYLPQIIGLFDSAQEPLPPMGETVEFAALLSQAGTYMWENGYTKDCRRVMEKTEHIINNLENPSLDWERADINSTLGIVCTSIGVSHRTEGLERCQRALAIRQKIESTYAPDVPLAVEVETVCAIADLARAYLEDEQFEKTEELMKQCYPHYQRWGTEVQEPWHWSRWYQHLAYVKTSRGEHVEAVQWAKHAVDLQEQATGLESSMTQIYRFALAHLLYHAGDYPQALSHFQTVYKACRHLLGHYNHLTLTSLFAYGMLQWINGDVLNAEQNIGACIHESKEHLWSPEQQARAQHYHSKLLRSLGKITDAEKLERPSEEKRAEFVAKYPAFLGESQGGDGDLVFDLMVPIGRMRFSGGLHGGRGIDWC